MANDDRTRDFGPQRNFGPESGEWGEKLTAHVLGEHDVLSDDERQAIEAYLESSEEARADAELLRRTAAVVASAAPAEGELETDRRGAVLADAAKVVATPAAGGGAKIIWRRLSYVAAAAVLVICALPFLYDLGDEGGTTEYAAPGGGSGGAGGTPVALGARAKDGVGITNVSQGAPVVPEYDSLVSSIGFEGSAAGALGATEESSKSPAPSGAAAAPRPASKSKYFGGAGGGAGVQGRANVPVLTGSVAGEVQGVVVARDWDAAAEGLGRSLKGEELAGLNKQLVTASGEERGRESARLGPPDNFGALTGSLAGGEADAGVAGNGAAGKRGEATRLYTFLDKPAADPAAPTDQYGLRPTPVSRAAVKSDGDAVENLKQQLGMRFDPLTDGEARGGRPGEPAPRETVTHEAVREVAPLAERQAVTQQAAQASTSGRKKELARGATALPAQPDGRPSAVRRRFRGREAEDGLAEIGGTRSLQKTTADEAKKKAASAAKAPEGESATSVGSRYGEPAGEKAAAARPPVVVTAAGANVATDATAPAAGASDDGASADRATVATGVRATRELGDSTTVTKPVVDVATLVDEYLKRLAPRAGESPDMMFFRYWGTNPFVEAAVDPLSTFAVDVDTASYTLLRKYLTDRGALPPREAVRTEEMVNYFKGGYEAPAEGAFAVHTEMAPSAFGHEPEYQLLRVGIKGREVSRDERKRGQLVFVVDTSGSMARENRLELVKEALRLLVRELDEGDTIGIVAFDREARTVLEPTPADQKETILAGIGMLASRHNTNVDAGLRMGYAMAATQYSASASNRVILLSDGVANTGVTDVGGMLENVKGHRGKGIYLTCVGVGMGNHNDTLLEQLADRGNGHCVYVDRLEEAQKVFVENLSGTLETIARDVKIQVEFDKEKVLRYRLLGYENRAIADSAFRDDTVDAGEVGAGHEVTALYEVKLAPAAAGPIATVRVRHLKVDDGSAVEMEHVVGDDSRRGSFADASARYRLASCVGEFAEILRDSYWARGSDLTRVAYMARDLLAEPPAGIGPDAEVAELVALMQRAVPLLEKRRANVGEIAEVVDSIRENTYHRVRAESIQTQTNSTQSYLQQIQEQNRELRQRLEGLLEQQYR